MTEEKISEQPIAETFEETDILLGNRGATTKQFPADVIRDRMNSGNQTVTGSMTAISLFGDGGGITGVIKTSGTQTLAGKMIATQFQGDGSLLTGVLAVGTGGTSSTGSLSLVCNSDNSTPAAKVVMSKFGTPVGEADENGFNIPLGSYKAGGEEILPPGVFGKLSNPLFRMLFQNVHNVLMGIGPEVFLGPAGRTYRDMYGVVQTAGSNVARFGKDGNLLEGPGENICLQSEDFDTTWAKARVGVTINDTMAPDGTMTADKLTQTIDTGVKHLNQIITSDSSRYHTEILFVKKDEITAIRLQLTDGGSNNYESIFDLGLGIVVSAGAAGTGTFVRSDIIELADDWYFIYISGIPASVDTGTVRAFIFLSGEDDLNATDGFYIWGADVKQSYFPQSYIPTTTTAVARTTEKLSIPFAGNFPGINDNVTVTIDFMTPAIGDPSGEMYLFNIDGISNGIGIKLRKVDGKIIMFHGSSLYTSVKTFLVNQMYKISYVVDGTNLSLYVDGVFDSSISQEVVTGTPTTIFIGSRDSAGSLPFYGYLDSDITIYKSALSASEEWLK
jgi:hypothetical protein